MKPRRPITAASLLAAAVFLLAYGVLGSSVTKHAQEGDFGCFYMGASLIRDGHFAQLYDYPTQAARWREIISPTLPPVPYVRPPFYAAVQSLVAVVPVAVSYWTCTIGSLLIVIGCWFWFGRRWGGDALSLASTSFAPIAGIAHGQDCALMMLIATVSFALMVQKKHLAAGAVLALALFKFHLLLLIGPLLLFTRRWRVFAGFASMAAAEALLSFALVGVGGIKAYIALMLRRDLSPLYPMPEKMPNLTGFFANLHVSSSVPVLLASLLVVAAAFYASYRAPWWRVFTAGVTASLLIIPHVFGYDATVQLPGLLFGFAESSSKLTRAVCVWLCCPLTTMALLFDPPSPALLPASWLLLLAALAWETWCEAHPAADSTPLPVNDAAFTATAR